ncbi:MAG: hypothetical protein J0I77_01815 [Rudaea sp.]|uniref:hypothetical protein n=1 Tax=unclassified Rudaea TaxID=2627037 RepID=UPI0010F906AD|nr:MULTISPECIES: hypothetical protein [unclassified Rudaea]MBN8884431.1 hypothetical protein [Rudaea sp.]
METTKANSNKRRLGQYFTCGNPFHHEAFKRWRRLLPTDDRAVIEPFAGDNHIVRLAAQAGWLPAWACWDIEPKSQFAEGWAIRRGDSLKNFPGGFRVAVTNPPYLAKNSATRRGLEFPTFAHDDLYKVALDVMLQHCDFVAAVVPESFITAGLFHDRLHSVVSLAEPMFHDTEHPVCLALFVPGKCGDFDVWSGDRLLGPYSQLKNVLPAAPAAHRWKFNASGGSVGLRALDNLAGASIAFVSGEEIPGGDVSGKSRSITRIAGCPRGMERDVIAAANHWLNRFRERSGDSLLTAFKGLRRDGLYRRRLDYGTAKKLLDLALADVKSGRNPSKAFPSRTPTFPKASLPQGADWRPLLGGENHETK